MESWVTLWTVSLYLGVAIFAVMSLWVIFAGLGDIKRMFADLRAQRDASEDIESK